MRDKDGKYLSIGDINDRITIQAGEPVLHYDNGSYHTSVHFKCASIKSVHGMYYVNIKNIFEKVLSVWKHKNTPVCQEPSPALKDPSVVNSDLKIPFLANLDPFFL